MKRPSPTIKRRDVLLGGAALTVGAVGASAGRIGETIDESGFEQVSLTIKTMPTDADEWAINIAQHLAENLRTAGIATTVIPKSTVELRRDVLTRGEFDLYVDRVPLERDPDFLRPLLGSVYADQNGWYNPFGFTDLTVDELLETQRTMADRRRPAVTDLLEEVAAKQPFVPVAVPDDIAAVRTDRFAGWNGANIADPRRYLELRNRGEGRAEELTIAVTDDRITRNLNPLTIRYRERGTVTGLFYEPLGRWGADGIQPRLADDWTWSSDDETTCRVTLRSDMRWHDGEALTSEDVAFTYRFVKDTSLGAADARIPAPHLFGRSTLVERVERIDERRCVVGFGDTRMDVARRALTVPILPKHVWEPLATVTDVPGVDGEGPKTDALTFENPEPVGSGPLAVERRVPEEMLVLSRVDDHFLGDADGEGTVDYDRLRLAMVPSAEAAVALAADGTVDGTMNLADAGVAPRIGETDSLRLDVDAGSVLYHVGCNVRRKPLNNPHFRRALARMVDKRYVTEKHMSGYGTPTSSAFPSEEWRVESLEWRDGDPEVPFVGENGEVEREDARELFREVGYDYDGERLVRS